MGFIYGRRQRLPSPTVALERRSTHKVRKFPLRVNPV